MLLIQLEPWPLAQQAPEGDEEREREGPGHFGPGHWFALFPAYCRRPRARDWMRRGFLLYNYEINLTTPV